MHVLNGEYSSQTRYGTGWYPQVLYLQRRVGIDTYALADDGKPSLSKRDVVVEVYIHHQPDIHSTLYQVVDAYALADDSTTIHQQGVLKYKLYAV